MSEVWHQQKGESAKAYAAFELFLSFDASVRSTAQVGRSLGKSLVLIQRWSSKYKWLSRAEARQKHDDIEADKARVRQIIEAKENHRKMARALMSKGANALKMLDPSKMDANDVIKCIDTSIKLERQALDIPNKNETNLNVGGQSDAAPIKMEIKMTPEQRLARIEELEKRRKAAGND